MWFVYIIRCADNSLYTGIAKDVVKRFETHQSGDQRSAKYLRSRHPFALVFTVQAGTRSEASRIEYAIKQLPKSQKEKLINGQISLSEFVE